MKNRVYYCQVLNELFVYEGTLKMAFVIQLRSGLVYLGEL